MKIWLKDFKKILYFWTNLVMMDRQLKKIKQCRYSESRFHKIVRNISKIYKKYLHFQIIFNRVKFCIFNEFSHLMNDDLNQHEKKSKNVHGKMKYKPHKVWANANELWCETEYNRKKREAMFCIACERFFIDFGFH